MSKTSKKATSSGLGRKSSQDVHTAASIATKSGPSSRNSDTKRFHDIPKDVQQKVNKAVTDVCRSLEEYWHSFCTSLERSDNVYVVWFSKTILRNITVEAPVVVGYCLICVVIHVLNSTILPGLSLFLGVDSHFSIRNPIHYARLFSHVFAHSSLSHLKGNMTYLLLVGPSAEAYFGSKAIFKVIQYVTLSSALSHLVLGKANSRQLGASGVVFAVIMLNSLVSAKTGRIPVSFVLIVILYLGEELLKLFFGIDGVSHHAHLVGGVVGTAVGFRQQQGTQGGTNQDGSQWVSTFKWPTSASTKEKKK